MIYRKTPPQQPRLLLRVVALAAAASMPACSSSSAGGSSVGLSCEADGTCDGGVGDAGPEDASLQNDGPNGIVGNPDAEDVCPGFCENIDSGSPESGPVGLFGNDSGSQDGGADQ